MVQVIGIDARTGSSVKLLEAKSADYEPEGLIRACLLEVVSGEPQRRMGFEKLGTLQVGVQLYSEGPDAVRPSLHLDVETIRLLFQADAELDFDPYVYQELISPST